MRGNDAAEPAQRETNIKPQVLDSADHCSLVNNLRFGDGGLLRDGTGDHQGGRTLKGR